MTTPKPTPTSVGVATADTFRAIWPIVDTTVAWEDLIREAADDIPMVAIQARAVITGPGAFRRERSARVPGSGNTTEFCLVFEAPARPAPHRGYHLPRSA